MHVDRQSPSYVLILPYYCEDEVRRYLVTVRALARFGPQSRRFEFLLAASPKAEISRELHDACAAVAPTTSFQCPTKVFGYPQGPTAMFWDCMDYIAANRSQSPGFSIWLESDMAIVKTDWLDRLAGEWESARPKPLMMGCFVPDVYRWRIFKGRKHLLHAHINGGACYAKDFALRIPAAAREGVFDMAIYPHASEQRAARSTRQIRFSTTGRARRDVWDAVPVVLHGFMQDKDRFIDACCAPITEHERAARRLDPVRNHLETLRRKIRVLFVRRGQRAMFENMLLAQERHRRAA